MSLGEGCKGEGGGPTIFLAPLGEGLPLVLGRDIEDVANDGPATGTGWVGQPPPRLDEAVDKEYNDGNCDELLEGD